MAGARVGRGEGGGARRGLGRLTANVYSSAATPRSFHRLPNPSVSGPTFPIFVCSASAGPTACRYSFVVIISHHIYMHVPYAAALLRRYASVEAVLAAVHAAGVEGAVAAAAKGGSCAQDLGGGEWVSRLLL